MLSRPNRFPPKKMPSLLSEENGCYVIDSFRKDGILAAFSDRRWNLKLKESESPADSEDRKSFCRSLGIDARQLICLEQVHGAGIALLNQEHIQNLSQWVARKIPKTDAAITKTPKLAFAIHTADCTPLFFLDSESRSVGLAHIGWRGAVQGLASKMVQAFQMNFRSRPEALKVAIGPAIGACCYEVGPEFDRYFPGFVIEKGVKRFFDLKGFIKAELVKAGLSSSEILDTELCTVCENSRFFSYRHEKETAGRLCSVMMIEP